MPKYLSGRVRRTPQGSLTTDRYRYLGLEQTEPNLGDAANPLPNIPSGTKFQIVSLREYPGQRFWSPIQGGIQPGSITVREEGIVTPPNGISSTTDINFKGAAITVEGFTQPNGFPGTAVTVTVAAPGTDHGVIFNDNGEFATSPFFTFDNSIGIGSVGIGTSTPSQNLHVVGNLRLEKTIYGEDNLPGDTGNLLVKTVTGGVKWVNQSSVEAGAGGTFGQIQYHGSAGLIDGATNFVFDYTNNRVGIGTTQPELLLDVKGNSKFTGFTTFTNDVRFNSNVSIGGTLTYEDVTNVDAIGLITARAGIRVLTNGVDVDSGGINVDAGGLNVTGLSTFNDGIFFPDQKKALFGNTATNADFEIRHNSDAGYNEIQSNNGNIRIRNYDTSGPGKQIYVQSEIVQVRSHTNNHSMISAFADAQVDLYHNNLLKLRTTGVGVTIFGELDTTNIRSVGIVTTNDLNVSGVVTSNLIPSLTNNFDLGSSTLSWRNLYVTNLVDVDRIEVQSLKVTGLSTFVGVVTTSSDLYVGGNLYGDDATNISGINSVTATEYYGTGGTGSTLFVPDEDENLIAGTNAGIGITAEGTGTNSSACNNVLLGYNAGRCITIGDHNIAMGCNTGKCLTTSSANVLIGREVGIGLSAGSSNNVFMGRLAGCIPYGSSNTILGYQAGQCISKASNSVFIGVNAGRGPAVDATTAGCTSNHQVFIGNNAGRCYTSGCYNVVLGSNAAVNASGGSYNFFALNCSARYHCNGSNNIAIGQYAMFCGGCHAGDGSASNNILLGNHTGCRISSGDSNTFIGPSAGRSMCTGGSNIAFGNSALCASTTPSQNIAMGSNSLQCNISGGCNVSIGYQSSKCQVSGSGNINLGSRVGFAATDGDNNILMGCCTARLMTCGNRNIIMGCCAGYNLTTGNENILIGCRVAAPITDGSTQFAIGYGTDYWITGNSSRDIGIGHTLPEAKLDVLDNTTTASHSSFIVRSNNSVTRDKKFEVFANGDTFIKGQVGIGTTNPTQKLEVKYGEAWIDNNSGDSQARSSGLTVSHAPLGNFTVGTDPTDAKRTATFAVKGASRAAIFTLRNLDDTSAFWDFIADGNTNKFYVQGHAARVAGLGPAITLDTSNNIGIGTDAPSAKLHIGPVDGDTTPHLYLASQNNDYGFRIDTDDFLSGNVPLRIFARANGTDTERIRVTQGGDLLRGGTGQDIGSSGSPWDKIYANEFIGQINTTQENVTTGNLKVNGIGTFVGNVEFEGSVSIAGTLTYEDVANIDAVGMVTARSGINITGGGLNVVGVSTFSNDLIIPEFIYHAGDLNTKFGFPTDDTISFETAGSERLRIGSTGISTFTGSLTVKALNIDTSGAGDGDLLSNGGSDGIFGIFNTTNSGKTVFPIKDSGGVYNNILELVNDTATVSGKVAIGTDSVDANLTVYTNTPGENVFNIHADLGTNNNRTFNLYAPATDSGDDPFIFQTGNSMQFKVDSHEGIKIHTNGKVGIGPDSPSQLLHLAADSAHQILLKRGGASPSEVTFGNEGNYAVISNNTNGIDLQTGSTPSSSMHIDQNGNVGIGTDDPTAPLVVSSSDNTLGILTSTDDGANLDLYDNDTQSRIRTVDGELHLRADVGNAVADSTIRFFVDGANEKLRITSAGNVGINSTVPQALLDIEGTGTLAKFGSSDSTYETLFIRNNLTGYPAIVNDSSDDTIELRSAGSVQVSIDYNNNKTDKYFRVVANQQGSSGTEVFRVQEDGKVGIGTNDPGALLDIGGNTDGNIQAIMTRGVDTSFQLQFRNETSSNSANATVGMFGLFRNATDIVGMQFLRGAGVQPGSLAFTTGGSEKLRITSGGSVNIGGNYTNTTDKFQVTGNAKINGNLTVTGVLTYDDVTNIDSVGIITAQSGINVTGGNVTIANDLDVDGHTELDSLNVSGISTFKDDVEFHGVSGITSVSFDKSDNSLKFVDNAKLKLGDSGDLQLYHDGEHSRIYHSGTGNLKIQGSKIQLVGENGEEFLHGLENGKVLIRYNNLPRIETTSLGLHVTGNVGIGTDNPTQLLDVYKTSNDAVIKTRTTTAGAYFEADSAAAAGYYGLKLSSGGTGKWFVGSYNSPNFQIKDGTISGGAERFTIVDGTGLVGIGTVAPDANLHVMGTIKVDSGNYARVEYARNDTNLWSAGLRTSDDFFFFRESGSGNVIFQHGNVGIGSTIPAEKLDVAGSAYVSNDIIVGDEIRNNIPSDFWSADNTFINLNGVGNLTHMGGYETNLTSNGYRSSDGTAQWVGSGVNGNTGAAQIGLKPQGSIVFRTDASKADGSSHNPTTRVTINSDGDLLRGGTGQDIGSASATWDKIYANEFIGQINTVQQNIIVNNLFVSGISTFVGVATFSSVGIGSAPTDFLTSDFVVGDGQSSSGMTIYSDGTLGQILFADGNTSDDRQRGKIVYDHSTNHLEFSTNAQKSVTIDNNGRIGIGTDSPSAELDIEGAAARIHLHDYDDNQAQIIQNGSALYFNLDSEGNGGGSFRMRMGGSTGANEVLRVTATGNVGIGTDSISQRLVVQDSIQLRSASENTILFFNRTDIGANGWIGIPEWNDDALYIYGPTSNGNVISAQFTQGDWTFYSGGNESLKIKNGGSVNIGGDYNQTTDKLQVTGNAKINGNLTVTGALTYDDVTNIDSIGIITARNGIHVTGGKVGIGTTTPTYDLEVSDGRAWFKPNETGVEAVALSLGRYDTATGSNQSFYDISVNDASGDDVTHYIKRYQANYFFNRTSPYGQQRAVRLYSVTGGGTYVGIYNTMGSDMNVKLHGNAISYINNDSHFGIGTSNPSTRLHLKGDGTSTSGLMFENSFDKFREYFEDNNNNSDFVITYEGTGGAELRFKADGDVVLNESGNGNVGIRNANPSYDLHVTGTVAATNFDSLSDRKHKTNIQVIENPIEKIMKIDGVSFDWKETNQPSLGVIADNIQEVLPEIVSGEDTKSVNYNGLIGLLIEVVKDQQKQIDELRGLLDK